MSTPLRTRAAAAAGALALLAAACGSDADPADTVGAASTPTTDVTGQVQVVATTSILGDIARQLVGDDGEVTVLMGPGVDPHAYQPSARDVGSLREADLVVANGLQLEESLVAVLAAAEEDGVRIFELAPLVDPIEYVEPDDHDDDHDDEGDDHDDEGDDHDDEGDDHDDGDDHGHGPEDPHVWFDPQRMATGVELLAAELAEVAPEVDASEWEARGAAYAGELRALDEELEAMFAAIPADDRLLVTNHDALGYLAARYDLTVVGTVIPGASTQAEADARRLSELVETVERLGITTVFAENTDSTRLAEQLASEVGRGDIHIDVVQISTDALGEPGSATDTFVGMLRETASAIAAALAG